MNSNKIDQSSHHSEEVIAIGDYLRLPLNLTHKTPTDGMSLNTDGDEAKPGVTYHEINTIIRTGEKTQNFDKVMNLCRRSNFKLDIIHMPGYEP